MDTSKWIKMVDSFPKYGEKVLATNHLDEMRLVYLREDLRSLDDGFVKAYWVENTGAIVVHRLSHFTRWLKIPPLKE